MHSVRQNSIFLCIMSLSEIKREENVIFCVTNEQKILSTHTYELCAVRLVPCMSDHERLCLCDTERNSALITEVLR